MRVYRNGAIYSEISNPYDLQGWAESSGIPFSELAFDLAEVKAWKELEVRDTANADYQLSVRIIEADAIIVKVGRRKTLTVDETAVGDEMEGRYAKLRQTVQSVRSATTWQGCLAIQYVYP